MKQERWSLLESAVALGLVVLAVWMLCSILRPVLNQEWPQAGEIRKLQNKLSLLYNKCN